eukprot:1021415-Pleurochrysis_carterae.AAC.2
MAVVRPWREEAVSGRRDGFLTWVGSIRSNLLRQVPTSAHSVPRTPDSVTSQCFVSFVLLRRHLAVPLSNGKQHLTNAALCTHASACVRKSVSVHARARARALSPVSVPFFSVGTSPIVQRRYRYGHVHSCAPSHVVYNVRSPKTIVA